MDLIPKLFISLNLPSKGLAAGTTVIASFNREAMLAFKAGVLREWQRRVEAALAEVNQLEYEKLKATLDLPIPDGPQDAADG